MALERLRSLVTGDGRLDQSDAVVDAVADFPADVVTDATQAIIRLVA
ncbi:MAG: hypothetical protein ACJ77E_08445 [Gaiellaceae bacterium]